MMNENPFEPLRHLGQMTDQLRQVFGDDFMSKLIQIPQPQFPMMSHMPVASDVFPGQKTSGWPPVDMYHTRSELVLVVGLPGLQSEADVKLYVDGHQIRIQGTLPSRYAHVGRDRFFLSEFRYGPFERVIDLPFPVRSDRTKARYRQGLLEVRLFKEQKESDGRKGQQVPILFD
jgi:HSP20 family protein